MRTLSIVRTFGTTFLVLLAFSGCPGSDTKPARIGYLRGENALPFLVAMEKGLFSQIKMQPIEYASSGKLAQELAEGRIDVAVGMSIFAFCDLRRRMPDKYQIIECAIETQQRNKNALLGIKRMGAQTSAIRSKPRVAFSGATSMTRLIANGLKLSRETEFVSVQLPFLNEHEVNVLVQSSSVDMVMSTSALLTYQLLRSGNWFVFVDNPLCKYVSEPFPLGVTIASTEFLLKHSMEATAFLDVLDTTVDSIRNDARYSRTVLMALLAFDSTSASNATLGDWWKSCEVQDNVISNIAAMLEIERK